jgi:hypothetical protein
MVSSTRVGLLILVLGFLGCHRDALAPDSHLASGPPSLAKPGLQPRPILPLAGASRSCACCRRSATRYSGYGRDGANVVSY